MISNQIRDLVQLLLLRLDCGKPRILQDIEVPIFGLLGQLSWVFAGMPVLLLPQSKILSLTLTIGLKFSVIRNQ